MSWTESEARTRIEKLVREVPDVDVRRFEKYLPLYEADKALMTARDQPISPPLFSLPRGKAVVVDTVQVYIAISNYDEYRLEEGRETEASHDRALRLLHLYYSAADRVIEKSPAQRVDFHNGRVHAVVLELEEGGVSRDTLARAMAFIEDFKKVADAANQQLANGEFNAIFRIGVDVGTCVAINNGTGSEQEPMFLGRPANHAAKLAQGEEPGVYVSDAVRKILGQPELGVLEQFRGLTDVEIATNSARLSDGGILEFGLQDRQQFTDEVVGNWRKEIASGDFPDFTDPRFDFSYQEPPLSEIDYAELMPSKSIRMPLVSMYADLSGYTDYIDCAVATGGIGEAVRALYVMRQEFQNVVEEDFGGRKVRFIGDCIHALIAEGSETETSSRDTVASATHCAGGLHSSFALCQSILGGLDSLGLAIGLELGPTPISRIGIRGDRSVRVASSIATARSEKLQKDCEHNGVKLGENALAAAPAALADILTDGFAAELDYGDVAVCLATPAPSLASPTYARAHVPSPTPEPRAHLKTK